MSAQPGTGIDVMVEALMRPVADGLAALVFFPLPVAGAEVPFVVLWLVVGALFFTLRFRFVSVRGFRHALRLVRSPLDPRSHGEVSHSVASRWRCRWAAREPRSG
jgi:AGCS family alanine or glycine:cation symporter